MARDKLEEEATVRPNDREGQGRGHGGRRVQAQGDEPPTERRLCRLTEEAWALSSRAPSLKAPCPLPTHSRCGTGAPSGQHVISPNSRSTRAGIPCHTHSTCVSESTTKRCDQQRMGEGPHDILPVGEDPAPDQKGRHKRALKYDETGPLDNSEKCTLCLGNQCLKRKTRAAAQRPLQG